MKFQIRHFPELDSTNTALQKLASEGAEEGLVISTDFQTGGRGKPGNKWISPKGKNLLFSVLLRPPVSTAKAQMLTQIVCRTVAGVLKKNGIDSTFKRPNDVLVNGKKICGVLTEAQSSGERTESVVVGVGLNVNAEPAELIPEATSMKIETKKDYPREAVLKDFLDQLNQDLKDFYGKD